MASLDQLLGLQFSASVGRELLSLIRTSGQRESQLVVDYGSKLVNQHSSHLGEEKWVIFEQVCVAALDVGDFQLSAKCISELSNQFPGSTRVKRLVGMEHEARGEFHKALVLYNKMLAEDQKDTATMKRKIAILVETRQPKKAIELLNEYLQVFMADTDAWAELVNLYLDQQLYKQAAFCLEELILAEPHNFHFYVKLAEVKYTLGTLDDLLEALHYYSFALELSKDSNLRAFYGLCLTASTLHSLHKGNVTPEALDAYKMAKEKILSVTTPCHSQIVQNMFSVLDFAE